MIFKNLFYFQLALNDALYYEKLIKHLDSFLIQSRYNQTLVIKNHKKKKLIVRT